MLRWLIAGCLILTACDGTDTDTTESDTDTDADTDTDTDTDTDSDTDAGVVMKGNVEDADGNPRQSPMQLCDARGCRFANPDGSGNFEFQGTFQPGPYLMYTAAEGLEAATNFTVIVPDPETVSEVTTKIVVYDVEEWGTIGASSATYPAGTGLTINAGEDNITLFDSRDKRVGGVRVDIDDIPELSIGTPVAGWYIRPFEGEVKSGQTMEFDITADWTGAGDGTKWEVFLGWYTWESLGVHTVSDGMIRSEIPAGKHVSSIWIGPGD